MSAPADEKPVTIAAWLGFLAMCVGMFMAILDIQVVAASLPDMATALNIPQDKLSWIQTSYLIAEIIAIPLTGFLTRAMSVRWLFAGSTMAFTIASIGCAMSNDFVSLITLRTIQGFCGGALIPAVFTSIFVLFPSKREAVATTIAGTFAMIAPTIGPALWWLAHANLFLARDLPRQCRARPYRDGDGGAPCACGRTGLETAQTDRLCNDCALRDFPRQPRTRAEGSTEISLARHLYRHHPCRVLMASGAAAFHQCLYATRTVRRSAPFQGTAPS